MRRRRRRGPASSRRERIAAIHFSCLGTPMPTQTMSACERSISSMTCACSSVGQRAVRRAVAADDLQARVAAAQVERELDERALVAAAVEEHPRAGAGGALAGARHQLGAVHAARAGRGRARSCAQTSGWPSGTVIELRQHGGAQVRILAAHHHGVRRRRRTRSRARGGRSSRPSSPACARSRSARAGCRAPRRRRAPRAARRRRRERRPCRVRALSCWLAMRIGVPDRALPRRPAKYANAPGDQRLR